MPVILSLIFKHIFLQAVEISFWNMKKTKCTFPVRQLRERATPHKKNVKNEQEDFTFSLFWWKKDASVKSVPLKETRLSFLVRYIKSSRSRIFSDETYFSEKKMHATFLSIFFAFPFFQAIEC